MFVTSVLHCMSSCFKWGDFFTLVSIRDIFLAVLGIPDRRVDYSFSHFQFRSAMKHDTTSAQCHEYMLSRKYEMTSLREAVSRCQKNSKAVGTSQIMQLNMSLTSRLFQKQTILQNRSPRYSKILPKRYPNLVVPQKPFRDEFGSFLGFQTLSRGF